MNQQDLEYLSGVFIYLLKFKLNNLLSSMFIFAWINANNLFMGTLMLLKN